MKVKAFYKAYSVCLFLLFLLPSIYIYLFKTYTKWFFYTYYYVPCYFHLICLGTVPVSARVKLPPPLFFHHRVAVFSSDVPQFIHFPCDEYCLFLIFFFYYYNKHPNSCMFYICRAFSL